MLPLVHELTLGVQAAAHVTTAQSEAGIVISPADEQRMLFASLRTWEKRGRELSPELHEAVGAEIALCATICAFFFMTGVSRVWDVRADTWNELLRQQQWDYQNIGLIRLKKTQILNELDGYVARLRVYLQAVNGLPLSEKDSNRRREVLNQVTEWTNEINRLRRGL